ALEAPVPFETGKSEKCWCDEGKNYLYLTPTITLKNDAGTLTATMLIEYQRNEEYGQECLVEEEIADYNDFPCTITCQIQSQEQLAWS
ncbi:hypothetical protein ACOV11_28050, partial [Vibrio natriegens]